MEGMRRVFHVFNSLSANGEHVIGLVENGVPKAMATIPRELFPQEDQDDAMIFGIAVVKAFGQTYPIPDDKKDIPWVE